MVSRKDFTQRQWLAILALTKLKKSTCRGVTDLLRAMPGVRDVLGITRVPHWTAPHKFATRRCTIEMVNAVLARPARDLIEATGGGKRAQAMDSTHPPGGGCSPSGWKRADRL